MPSLTKAYLEYFFYSLDQVFTAPTRAIDRTAFPIDYVLSISSYKVSQPGVIDPGLSDERLIDEDRI